MQIQLLSYDTAFLGVDIPYRVFETMIPPQT